MYSIVTFRARFTITYIYSCILSKNSTYICTLSLIIKYTI